MHRTLSKDQCLVVCGEPCVSRIDQAVLPHLDFKLQMVAVEFKEDLIDALIRHQPPLCVVEFQIPIRSTLKDANALVAEGLPPEVAEMLAGSIADAVPAHVVIDEAASRSPGTKFIIACHNKGYDVPNAHAAEFMRNPATIKRMGFINGLANMRYLAKLFTRTYADKAWDPKF